jgi:hypothetical protein
LKIKLKILIFTFFYLARILFNCYCINPKKRFQMLLRKVLPLLLCFFFILQISCKKKDASPGPATGGTKKNSAPASSFDRKVIDDYLTLQLNLIKSTAGFASPVAARALAYTSIATYESFRPGIEGAMSLKNKLQDYPNVPEPDSTKEYHWALVYSVAQAATIKELYTSTSSKNARIIDSVRLAYETKYKTGISDAIFQNSLQHGTAIAGSIITYAKKDGGANGATNNFPANYTLPSKVGSWKPTSTQKVPLLPSWGNNRLFIKTSADSAFTQAPPVFSFAKETPYFIEAKGLVKTAQLRSEEQEEIARFFEDGQGTVSTPGHYFYILAKLMKEKTYKIDKMAPAMLKLGVVLNDAYVAAWKSKYAVNHMRPQSYINDAIDPKWKSFLTSPLSPEYPSDYAVAAGAFYSVMSGEFGKDIGFLDDLYSGSLSVRSFEKLDVFLDEATNAPVYSGTGFQMSSNHGRTIGQKIGIKVLNELKK